MSVSVRHWCEEVGCGPGGARLLRPVWCLGVREAHCAAPGARAPLRAQGLHPFAASLPGDPACCVPPFTPAGQTLLPPCAAYVPSMLWTPGNGLNFTERRGLGAPMRGSEACTGHLQRPQRFLLGGLTRRVSNAFA